MKTACFIAILSTIGCLGLQAQNASGTANTTPTSQTGVPAPTAYQVIGRGANRRVWQHQVYEKLPNGRVVSHVNSYTELGSGMHYRDANGQWAESQALIEPYANGAIARYGQYQVIFANNLNSASAIDQQTPDGKRLRSNILGLAYYDSSSGQSVMIAQIQDSSGELISSNQVLYPDAFSGVKADVRYTYRIGSFEQDVILREQPPTPESLGLNSDTTTMEVITEFVNPPDLMPAYPHRVTPPEQEISWGAMRLGSGKAFDLGDPGADHMLTVDRQYVTMDDRKILLEKLPWNNLQSSISNLPQHAARKTTSRIKMASRGLSLPATPLARITTQPLKLAVNASIGRGYVLDYIELDSDQDNYTFQADMTYYISSPMDINGDCVIEGGTVLKFNTGIDVIYLQFEGGLVCATSPYRPAIITSKNDNSVGQSIYDSSQSLYYYWTGIAGASSDDVAWHDMRVKYAHFGMDVHSLHISDSQFVDCVYPIVEDQASGGSLAATNILIENAGTAFSGAHFTTVAYQVTVNNCTNLTYNWYGSTGSTIALTNSLLVNVQNVGPAALSSNYTAWVTDPGGTVLQTVGGGSAYLASGSPYLGAGSTNVAPGVLADMAQNTVYPPVVYGSGTVFATNLTLAPQAARDTNTFPALGYHYPPLDYALAGVTVSNNVTLSLATGTVMGWYHDSSGDYGVTLKDGANLTSAGTVTQPCWITHTCLAQEGNGNWENSGAAGVGFSGDNATNQPQMNLRFTKWSGMNFIANDFDDGGDLGIGNYTDCEFYDGAITSYKATQLYTNCLFFRMGSAYWAAATYTYQNCTFYNGAFISTRLAGQPSSFWTFRNTAFDGLGFQINDNFEGTNYTAYDYNAYNTSNLNWQTYPYYSPLSNTLETVGVHDLLVTNYNWQNSWFGGFYLPTNSPLIDAGSTTADRAGLYEFTTQTNQTQEGISPVDMGYHYVAVDCSGNPASTLVDGVADYLTDTNGDGLPDDWELGIFGDLSHSGSDLDFQGNTLVSDYLNGVDVQTIQFTMRLGNQYFNTTNATGSFVVLGGMPAYEAVMVNSTNFAAAVWTNYDGTARMMLGATDGVYQVWLGLKGYTTNSPPAWHGAPVTLNRTPPRVFITSPATNLVTTPYVQLQGCATLPLAGVRYDISNAVEVVTNQLGSLINHYLDTNTSSYTTDYFQCYDILLTNGLNVVTLHCTDPAGNVTTTNLNLTLDYSSATDPVVQLTWPTNGMQICSSSINLRGWTDDSSAQVVAQITDTNGDTNVVCGFVERTGVLWAKNLPLAEGTNWITLWVTNAAGLSSVTNLSVVKNDMILMITNIVGDLWLPTVSLSGFVSDTTASVWVNGTQGTNNGDGTWSATNVPTSSGGVASFDAAAVPGGGGSPSANTSTDSDKPTEQITQSATWSGNSHYDLGPLSGEGWELVNYSGNYTYSGGGSYTYVFQAQYTNQVPYDTTTTVTTLAPGGAVTDVSWSDTMGNSHDFGPDGSLTIAMQNGKLSIQNPISNGGTPLTAEESSSVKVVVQIGGAGKPGQQVLVCGGVTAGEDTIDDIIDGQWTLESFAYGPGIDYSQISLGQLGSLDTNGFAYGTATVGAAVDVTPTTSSPMFNFNVGAGGFTPVSTTHYPALTDTNLQRTTLGVGEEVSLSFSPTIADVPSTFTLDWTTSAGGVSGGASTAGFVAPSNAMSATVTATVHGNGTSVSFPTFNVVEPSGYDHANIYGYDTGFAPGVAGVGILLFYYIAPTDVSFYRVEILEVKQPPASATGFFAPVTNYIDHAGWATLDTDNHMADSANISSIPPPWSAGSLSYNIPALWKIGDNGQTNSVSSGWNQTVTIDSQGATKMEKFGHWGQRDTNGVYTFSAGDPSP